MATYSSILPWRIPWTEEPGGLESIGWQKVRHDWLHTHKGETDFLYTPYPHTWIASPLLPKLYTFFFNDESTSTHYYLESIVYIRVHSWCSIFYGFERFYKDIKTQKILNCSTWIQSQKQQNDLCLQSKPFNIIVLKVYVPMSNTEEAEVEWFSVQFSHSVVSDSLGPHESQHTRLPCPSPTPGVHPNSCPSSWWCHPAISSSVVPFSFCSQSLPASGSFPMS